MGQWDLIRPCPLSTLYSKPLSYFYFLSLQNLKINIQYNYVIKNNGVIHRGMKFLE